MLNYQLDPQAGFQIPQDAIQLDVMPDGRLVAVGIDKLWRESTPGSRSFQSVQAPSFGNPAFVRVSPSGKLLAIGSYENSNVRVFDIASGGSTVDKTIAVSPYDAEWWGDEWLAVSGQGSDGLIPPSTVHVLDIANATAYPLIVDIPGYSGGVTFDVDGNVYTGLGRAVPTSDKTGLVKAFPKPDFAAVATGSTLDFNSQGRECIDLLSAAFLTFDGDNNLCVAGGGGQHAGSPDMGYVGMVSHHGLRAALHDKSPVDPGAASHVFQELDPTTNNAETYWVSNVNPVRREVYVFEYASRDIHVFKPSLRELCVHTHMQLGDNPGYYKGVRFVGMKLRMPFALPDPSIVDGGITIRLSTQFVETLGVSKHKVSLGGRSIGEMTGGYFVEERETFDVPVSRSDFLSIYSAANPAEFTIAVDPAPGRGLADDFVLRSVGCLYKPV